MSGYPGGGGPRWRARLELKEKEREARESSEREAAVERALGGRPQLPTIDVSGVSPLVEMLSNVTQREMQTAHDYSGVTQRCRACCAEIVTRITDDWERTLAHAIRFDYESHRCTPIDIQLHGCSPEELTQLLEDTERDLERTATRASAIQAEIRRRG